MPLPARAIYPQPARCCNINGHKRAGGERMSVRDRPPVAAAPAVCVRRQMCSHTRKHPHPHTHTETTTTHTPNTHTHPYTHTHTHAHTHKHTHTHTHTHTCTHTHAQRHT